MLLRSDDEQAEHDRQYYKTMLQGTVYEGRCYEMVLRRTAYDGQNYEETRHLRNGYMHSPLTGGEPSLSRSPSGTLVEGGQLLPHPNFPPGKHSLPGDGRRTRPDRLAWLTGAALWLCSRLVHLFYTNDIPRPERKGKPVVFPWTDLGARSAQKEVCRCISTTPNFPVVERVEDELRGIRESHGLSGSSPCQWLSSKAICAVSGATRHGIDECTTEPVKRRKLCLSLTIQRPYSFCKEKVPDE
jgi:hypothetical protein